MTPLTRELFTVDATHARLAREITTELSGDATFVADGAVKIPDEIADVLVRVLRAMASGQRLTITTMPRELTSTVAASLLGVSRPTLMKLAKEGQLPSHKVGSHARFLTDDVLKFAEQRAAERRAGAERMRELADELGLAD